MTDTADPHPSPAEQSTRIVLRPLGNSLPLGFLALTGATFMLSGLQLGWIQSTDTHDVAVAILAFVVPAQLLAAVLGFLARDVVAGTGMGILTGTWLTVGIVLLRHPPGTTSDALGLLLLAASAAMLVAASGAILGKLVPAAVLITTAVRLAVTGVYELTGARPWKTTAGMIGLALAAIALYAALAMLVEDVRRRPVLPLARRGSGLASMTGGLAGQLQQVDREAGVREQL